MDPAAADLPALADLWRWCATESYTDSVLYRTIAARVADDPDLIGLTVAAGTAHAQFPNVLMAAVHELVLLGAAPDLAAHYGGDATGDPFPAFRATCLEHREALLARMATRFTNTNEVGRSAVVALALAHVTASWDAWALVEAGASAGINLCYDRFHLDYGAAGTLGDPTSSVHVTCEDRRGDLVVPEALALPRERVGLDRDPVDLTDEDERRWLLACTWPDTGRLVRTAAAHELVGADPPPVAVGDMVTDLPDLLAATAPELPVVVLTTWVVAYLSPDERSAFAEGLATASRTRPVTWVSAEGRGEVPLGDVDLGPPDGGTAPSVLGAISYADGDQVAVEVLGACHAHGRWVDWRPHGSDAARIG